MSAFTTRAPALSSTSRNSLRSAVKGTRCNGRVHGFKGASAAASYQQSRRFEHMAALCTAAPQAEAQSDPPAAAAAAAAVPEVSPVTAMDIRIGQILSVEKHPDADNLYVESVDVGEAEPRTIVSGLVEFVPLDAMQQRKVVVLCNLQARNMRGVKSHGMLLCASNADHSQVEPLDPPAAAPVGERVWFGNDQLQPAPESSKRVQKKKIWEAVQPDLKTTDYGIAVYKTQPMTTSAGPVIAKILTNANIS